ncbi:MAG: hypothetical protein GY861_08680 [bacterium]|nr:hypothetical protein [bacterium]
MKEVKLFFLVLALLLTLFSVHAADVAVYVVPAITDDKILPTSSIPSSYISDEISITASPGEFEPASFVVKSTRNINDVQITASSLSGPGGSIPIDIRVVKVWYQSGDGTHKMAPRNMGMRFFTPELLLKNDALIKTENNHNYALVSGQYKLISANGGMIDGTDRHKISEFPIKDADTLQPVDLVANKNKQFWITIEVPENKKPGVYTGTIRVTASGLEKVINLNVEVLPIDLDESMLIHGIFYESRLRPDRAEISIRFKNEEQYLAELQNMKDHGIRYPSLKYWLSDYDNYDVLRDTLSLRDQVGFPKDAVYFLDWSFPVSPQRASSLVSICKDFGYDDVYIYGKDEARGSQELLAEVSHLQAYRNAGAKVWQGGAKVDHYSDADRSPGVYGYISEYIDHFVAGGWLDPEEAERWHSSGSKITVYNNPQCGQEMPEKYRRNYGLLMWQKDYDGSFDFQYMTSGADVFGHAWNDFMSGWRDHTMAYPTANGVIDTIQWEGWREGTDDLRYLTTLINLIESTNKDTSAAENYLANLKNLNLETKELDIVRSEIVSHIISLQGTSEDPSEPIDTYFVSTSGNDDNLGTKERPWRTIKKAANTLRAGDTVYIRGGTYFLDSHIRFGFSGNKENQITFAGYQDEKVIIDGSNVPYDSVSWKGLLKTAGDWIVLEKFDVTNSAAQGVYVASDNTIIRSINSYNNGGSGFMNSGGNSNQFLNVVAHHNYDPEYGGEHADGISLSTGSNNIVRDCIVYENSDDGLDTWTSTGNLIEGCISYDNGYGETGNGIGFKLGKTGGNNVRRCVSYNNRVGFDNNGGIDNLFDHCTAYNNDQHSFVSYIGAELPEGTNTYTNNIGTSMYIGTKGDAVVHHNSWNMEITNPGFVSTNPDSSDFLKLKQDSPCRGVDSAGGDLGAYEYTGSTQPPPESQPEDINQDGKIDILDLILIGQHMGYSGSPGWIKEDVKQDGTIDILDMILVAQHQS